MHASSDRNLVGSRYQVVYGAAHVIKGAECCRVHRVRWCILEHIEAPGALIQSPRKLPVQDHLRTSKSLNITQGALGSRVVTHLFATST